MAEVPRACNLTLTSGDGSVTVERVSGTISLNTKDGAVRGFELDGNLTVETGDGSVKLEHVAGSMRVRTGDGPVWLGGRLGQVSVFTGDGPVALKLEPGSRVDEDWDVTTQDGGVVLYVSPDFAAQIDAATGDGAIKIDEGVSLGGQSADQADAERGDRRRRARAAHPERRRFDHDSPVLSGPSAQRRHRIPRRILLARPHRTRRDARGTCCTARSAASVARVHARERQLEGDAQRRAHA